MVKESSCGKALHNSQETYHAVKPLFSDISGVESMFGIFFNAKNRILAIEKLFAGSLSSCAVFPREIVKKTLELNAASLILVHNHPSGDVKPSPEDFRITFKVINALMCIDTKLHDHVIIGDGYLSMADEGILQSLTTDIKSDERVVWKTAGFLGDYHEN